MYPHHRNTEFSMYYEFNPVFSLYLPLNIQHIAKKSIFRRRLKEVVRIYRRHSLLGSHVDLIQPERVSFEE